MERFNAPCRSTYAIAAAMTSDAVLVSASASRDQTDSASSPLPHDRRLTGYATAEVDLADQRRAEIRRRAFELSCCERRGGQLE
jgi:hypothetical protein